MKKYLISYPYLGILALCLLFLLFVAIPLLFYISETICEWIEMKLIHPINDEATRVWKNS